MYGWLVGWLLLVASLDFLPIIIFETAVCDILTVSFLVKIKIIISFPFILIN